MPACIKPVTIKLSNGLPQTVACGRCVACRVNRTRAWTVRCMMELETYDYKAQFQTLTISDDFLPDDYSLRKRDLQLYFKRLRKSLGNRRIRYFACGEYGDRFGRPHYHAIVFGVGQSLLDKKIVRDSWHMGFVCIGRAEWDSIQYVTKYIQKKWTGTKAIETYGQRQPPFQLQSKGLGLDGCKKYLNILRADECIKLQNGKIAPIPSYIRRKLDIDTSLYDTDFMLEKQKDIMQYIDSEKIDKLYDYYQRMHQRDLQRQVNLDAKSALAAARSSM